MTVGMAYSPSLGDIVLVCRFANTVWTKFRDASDDFRETTREIGSLALVLEDINLQSRAPWSPLHRNFQVASNMKACVAASKTKLDLLSEKMDKYNSLGTKAPKPAERALFITQNFNPLREELRRTRQDINTQLELCNTDALGRILKIISERAADEKAGRRQTIISGGGADGDDVLSIVTEDLHRHRVPQSEIEIHKADIQAYVDDLRASNAFHQDDGWTELNPSDSISQLNVATSVLTLVKPASHPSTAVTGSIELFRGVSVHDVSYQTIVNPHTGLRGLPRPGTSDIWGMAEASWSLQRRLTGGIAQAIEVGFQVDLDGMARMLCTFDAILVIVLADSSTNGNFWPDMRETWTKRKGFVDVHDYQLFGNALVKLLRGIDQQLDRWEAFQNSKPSEVEVHLSGFKRLQRSLLLSSSSSSRHSRKGSVRPQAKAFEWSAIPTDLAEGLDAEQPSSPSQWNSRVARLLWEFRILSGLPER